jgi:transcription initiation factor TFIIIB Brf1 subunit/transcription initiation factor TFIIB
MSTKCPYCGENPVVYDYEFSEYVCPHCGAVLEDRPVVDDVGELRVSDEGRHIGSYILNPNYRRLMLRNISVVCAPTGRRVKLALRLLRGVCDVLGVPEVVCLSAERRLLSAVDKLRGELVSRPKATHLLRLLVALSLYVTSRELGCAVSLEDAASAVGVSAGRLYSALWEYRELLGYRHVDTTELYLARVMRALGRQLPPDRLERVVKLTRELMQKYPVTTGKPVHRILAYAIVACRLLRLDVSVVELCRELGVSDHIYIKAARLYRIIKGWSDA